MIENDIGINQNMRITNPLDIWSRTALGSSSRVFFSVLQNRQNLVKSAAIKIMDPGKREYALPLFMEEIKILNALDDIPGIVRMSEMGFIKFDDIKEFPAIETSRGCDTLTGKAIRFELDEVINIDQIDDWVSLGWLPYIALGVKDYHQNLFMLCDRVRTANHKVLNLKVALDISVQLCRIFSEAHKRNIVYFDHKIFHYYWYGGNLSQAYVIDWNVGKMHTMLTAEQKNFDIVQFAARGLHFIFTGRTAPGSLTLGSPKTNEIQYAPYKYKVNWLYDDREIPDCVKELISGALNGEYTDFSQLQKAIEGCQSGTNI